MQLTGGEGGAHAVLERRARVVIERRPQLNAVLGRPVHEAYGEKNLDGERDAVYHERVCGRSRSQTAARLRP